MAIGNLGKAAPVALGEIQRNQQDRSPIKPKDDGHGRSKSPTKSPTKSAFPSLKSIGNRWGSDRTAASREPSPTKPPKSKKSSSNLAGLLSRPKSFINLRGASNENNRPPLTGDKENQSPEEPPTEHAPIYAQFKSTSDDKPKKERPQSCHPSMQAPSLQSPSKEALGAFQEDARDRPVSTAGFRGHTRGRSVATAEPAMEPSDIAKHLEALLDRRNIPQNQRYKMRNLSDTIKMEFIRQDWAEMKAGQSGSLSSSDGKAAATAAVESEGEDDASSKRARGRSRGRSFTFARSKRDRSSSKKPKTEGTLGRHFRGKSTESVGRDRPESSGGSAGSSVLSKIKFQQGPGDYVAYLRKVQKPEVVEVGKLHKLRLLLRNETVAWTEDFIRQGGMEEIAGLLNRIMEVEWREEHEDALLHENLLCLKALSTTALGMEYLHTVQADLFAKLLHMIFDPEKKGPSEFTTRNIITSVLLMYISSASPAERIIRAKNVLGHLRDPQPKEEDQLPFLLGIHQERPYRVWCKEVVSVTKEVFWIFLHNMNVVALAPANLASPDTAAVAAQPAGDASLFGGGGSHDAAAPYGYMHRHFAAERPPVAAAPYVGGVEWDATNYLASHVDLVNAIVACTATRDARNALRAQLRISGWERCMGGSLRLCKEKFYGSVHAALRTWVAAAAEDGWDVRDVRFGPEPAATTSRAASPRKTTAAAAKAQEAPKLDMPRFDLGL